MDAGDFARLVRDWVALSFVAALLLACSSAVHSTADDSTADDSTAGSASYPPDPCPATEPADGSSCPLEGATCHYHGEGTDSFCTHAGTWQARVFEPSPAPDGSVAGPLLPAGYLTCDSMSACQAPCVEQCCLSQPPSSPGEQGGCAFCCAPPICESYAGNDCPTTQCALLTGCGGESVCTELWHYLPACGLPGLTQSQVPCCAGLTLRCRQGASADPDPSLPSPALNTSDLPTCIACGDGTCDPNTENRLNCPEDCGG